MSTPTQPGRATPASTPLAVDTSTEVTTPSDNLLSPAQTKSRSNSVLQSTRPAPPSPVPSRPGSQLFNHSPNLGPSSPRDRSGSNSSSRVGLGSSMNRRVSGASSRHSDREKTSRRKSTLGHNFSLPVDENDVDPSGTGTSSQPTSTGHTTPADTTVASTSIPEDTTRTTTPTKAETEPKKPVHTILIRDYGFPEGDERFFGRGQIQAAKKEKWRLSNFTLGRRPSESGGASGEGSPKSPETGSDTDERRGWGFGFLASGWKGFARKRSTSSESRSSVPIHDEPEDTDDVDDDDYFSDEHDESDEPYGTYRAAYSFEAEGEHEMSMTEGDVIEVRGRGGGEGWVIGSKGGQEGLVPEGYLERYIPGRDALDDDEIEELQDDNKSP